MGGRKHQLFDNNAVDVGTQALPVNELLSRSLIEQSNETI